MVGRQERRENRRSTQLEHLTDFLEVDAGHARDLGSRHHLAIQDEFAEVVTTAATCA
jgi:hypothetical protein